MLRSARTPYTLLGFTTSSNPSWKLWCRVSRLSGPLNSPSRIRAHRPAASSFFFKNRRSPIRWRRVSRLSRYRPYWLSVTAIRGRVSLLTCFSTLVRYHSSGFPTICPWASFTVSPRWMVGVTSHRPPLSRDLPVNTAFLLASVTRSRFLTPVTSFPLVRLASCTWMEAREPASALPIRNLSPSFSEARSVFMYKIPSWPAKVSA